MQSKYCFTNLKRIFYVIIMVYDYIVFFIFLMYSGESLEVAEE